MKKCSQCDKKTGLQPICFYFNTIAMIFYVCQKHGTELIKKYKAEPEFL